MKALILAGGFATRLWPLTEKRAKPLVYINGKPIISHIVDKIPHYIDIIVSTNRVFQSDFQKWRESYPERNIKIFIEDSGSDDFKKGALGATAFVIQQENIEEDLMLLAGDNLFGFDMHDFLQRYKQKPLLAVYDVKEMSEARKFGVVITEEDRVVDFQEKPIDPKSTLASTGCYIFPKRNLDDIIYFAKENNDNLGGVFEYFLEKKETIHYYPFDENWYDIGSFDSYIDAHKTLQKEEKIIEEGVRIDDVSSLLGSVFIREGCTIKNALIEDSIIMEDCAITDCVIRNCVIDKDCVISGIDLNSKIIREGTEIAY